MAALNGQEPDQVPYCELNIDRVFAAKLLGWDEKPYLNALDEETPFTFYLRGSQTFYVSFYIL